MEVCMNHAPGSAPDWYAQLRILYLSLLGNPARYSEFKQLLALYPLAAESEGNEPDDASSVRLRLNEKVRVWVGERFEGFSASQVLQWRAIVVEERIGQSAPGREPSAC
jgi:hypothetical protein